MLKKIAFLLLFTFVFNVTFASTVSLKKTLNDNYDSFIQTAQSVYKDVITNIDNIKDNMWTWDYRILWYLTWISIDDLFDSAKIDYKNLVKDLTSSKYDIIADVDFLENSLKNSLITTWEYENEVERISSLVSWYNLNANNYINLYKKNTSDYIEEFVSSMEDKKKVLKDDIETYKDFEDKLDELNNAYDDLEIKNNKIKDIIWISKDLLDSKSQEIRDYVNNYFSWYIQKEYKNFIDSNENLTYFEKDFKDKKEIILWFVNNKITDIISFVTNNYYPNIKLSDIKTQVDDINNLSAIEVVKNYQDIKNSIKDANETIKNYIEEVSWKLDKFDGSTEKENVFNTVKEDIINGIKDTLPTVTKELQNSFDSWKDFIKNKEQEESPIMSDMMVFYNEVMTKWNLQDLKDFIENLNNYENVLSMPKNLDKLKKYKKAVEEKIEEVKYEEVANQLDNMEKTIENLKIWEGKDKIKEIENNLENLKDHNNFNDKIENIKLKIKLQENLNKLHEVWAIRYYYQYGDLSDTVSNILAKYYHQYEEKGEKDKFEDKINSAFDKINILSSSLSNDKRSYYIIMIYNGLLKYKNR